MCLSGFCGHVVSEQASAFSEFCPCNSSSAPYRILSVAALARLHSSVFRRIRDLLVRQRSRMPPYGTDKGQKKGYLSQEPLQC